MRILLVRNVLGSIGDEAMLRADHDNLHRRFPDAEIQVLTDDPDHWKNTYRWSAFPSDFLFIDMWFRPLKRDPVGIIASSVRRITRFALLQLLVTRVLKFWVLMQRRIFLFNAKRLNVGKRLLFMSPEIQQLLRRISSADAVFAGGWLFPEKKEFLWSRLAFYKAVQILGKPLILHGQHVPEVRSKPERNELTKILSSVACVSTRDGGRTESYLSSYGVPLASIHRGIDPALYLRSAQKEEVDRFLRTLGAPIEGPVLIGVNINVLNRSILPRLRDLYREVCIRAAGDLDVHYVLFGMQNYATVDESAEMRSFSRLLPSRVKFSVLPHSFDAALMKGVIASLYAVISGRYHAAVFAFSSGIPAVGIPISENYREKLAEVFGIFHMENFLLRTDDISPEQVLLRLKAIRDQSDTLRSSLRQRHAELRALQDAPFEALAKVV